jgi:hypothetical protein
MGLLMTIIVLALRRRLKPTLRVFFWYDDLKKKRVGYPSVLNFEWTYANKPWVPSDPGPDDVNDEPPFGSLQFTVLVVLNALMDLDSNRIRARLVFRRLHCHLVCS